MTIDSAGRNVDGTFVFSRRHEGASCEKGQWDLLENRPIVKQHGKRTAIGKSSHAFDDLVLQLDCPGAARDCTWLAEHSTKPCRRPPLSKPQVS